MKIKEKKLSIIITYAPGRSEQLKRGLNSLYFQDADFRQVELLFFNDGGEAEIFELLKHYIRKFKIRYYLIRRNKNEVRHCVSLRNFLIRQALGKYIMFTEPEVVHFSETIKQALEAESKYGEKIWYCGKVYGTMGKLDKKGNFISTITLKDVNEDIKELIGPEPSLKKRLDLEFFKKNKNYYLLNRKSYPTPSLWSPIRKSLLEKVRGFNENMIKWGFDEVDLYNRLKKLGIKVIYDKNFIVYHLPHKTTLRPEERKCWCVYNASIPFDNLENWGSLKGERVKEYAI